MDQNLNNEERELIRLVNFFRKRGEILIIENKLGDEYRQLLETCDKFVEQMNKHAASRAAVLEGREQLAGMIKDQAKCPGCHSAEMLKASGTEKNEQGWTSNKYRCRKCNISFVWNTPNNPWDMIPYVEKFITDLDVKLATGEIPEQNREHTLAAMEQMRKNIEVLRPVVDDSDRDFREMTERETQMAALVRQFKKQLQIEKIKLED